MHGIREQARFVHFLRVAHIEKELAVRLPIFRRDGFDVTAHDVSGNKCGGIHRIVCRAERWRVSQVEALEIEDGHFAGNRSRKNVCTLVHAIFAHDLRAQHAPGSVFGNDFDPHWLRAGIVTRVVGVNRYAGEEAESGFGSLRAVQAGDRRGHIEDTDN